MARHGVTGSRRSSRHTAATVEVPNRSTEGPEVGLSRLLPPHPTTCLSDSSFAELHYDTYRTTDEEPSSGGAVNIQTTRAAWGASSGWRSTRATLSASLVGSEAASAASSAAETPSRGREGAGWGRGYTATMAVRRRRST